MREKINLKTIKQIDRSDMLGLLLDFPRQCKAALDIAERGKILCEKKAFTKIVFAGLGGSAIGADLVKSYLYSEIKIPILVFREYELPESIDASTLVFVLSYSGNTEETISAYKNAKDKGATLITVSSGGAIKEYAKKDNFAFIEIPGGLPPRCALGYLSIIPLCILAKLGLIKDVTLEIKQMIKVLEGLDKEDLSPDIAQKDNLAKSVALKLYNKFTVIYSASVHFDVCATRLRGQLAENSKALSSSHVFPEMNHNEIVGWENPTKLFKDFVVILLRDKDMHPRLVKRMEITRGIIKKEGVTVIEIWPRGDDLLSRIFSLIHIGDFISYYLALLYGIDPTPVERIAYLKKELAKE